MNIQCSVQNVDPSVLNPSRFNLMHAYLHCNINFVETGSMHQNVPSDLSASVPV